MKHIAFAVVAAAALAVIGPRIAQENPRTGETAAPAALSIDPGSRATPSRSRAAPILAPRKAQEAD